MNDPKSTCFEKNGCFYTPLNGITCYTLKYVISTVFNRFKSTNMNLEAKIIAEIVFFYQIWLSRVCSKWEETTYQK